MYKMLAQSYAQFIIVLIFSLIPLILSQCAQEVNQCLNKFATDLEVHKKHQFSNPDNQFNDICHPSNGIYSKFVACITGAEGVCASDPNFKQYVCESRKLKMRINRFNWKPTFFHHLCLNTSHDLSQGFIRHEECISGVLNARNWKCDVNYDKPIKNMRDWRKNINTTCSLWRKFRDCSRNDVKQKCGSEASTLSDGLFHGHQSYFEKYYSCELEGTANDRCWYDIIHTQSPDIPVQTQTTTTTEPMSATTKDMTDNNVDSSKGLDLMVSNDHHMSPPDRGSQITATDPTLNDTNLSDEKTADLSVGQSWVDSRNDSLLTSDDKLDTNTDNQFTDQLDRHRDSDSGQLMYTSMATTDSMAAKYLLILPVIMILFVKYIAK